MSFSLNDAVREDDSTKCTGSKRDTTNIVAIITGCSTTIAFSTTGAISWYFDPLCSELNTK